MTALGLDCGTPDTVIAQLAGGAATPLRLDRGEPLPTFDGNRVSGRRLRLEPELWAVPREAAAEPP